ncbi:MAG: hypothetical protein LBE17_03880 [Treponema sp.]|jgi:hypothetical protein|nr:hypothetical protein [Treponema sp.]
MKRCLLSIITLLFSAALAFAQAGHRNQGQFSPGTNPGPGQFQNVATIQGNLSFVNGQIAVKSGETTYYVKGLDRLFGFADGLKEGAAVTLEGYAVEIPSVQEYKYFLTEKLTFNGKDYTDLLPERRMGHAFAGGPGFPPPAAGMTHNRQHVRRLPPSYYHDRDR